MSSRVAFVAGVPARVSKRDWDAANARFAKVVVERQGTDGNWYEVDEASWRNEQRAEQARAAWPR